MEILKKVRVVKDTLRDVIAVTLDFQGEKVGKMKSRKATLPDQGDMKILT